MKSKQDLLGTYRAEHLPLSESNRPVTYVPPETAVVEVQDNKMTAYFTVEYIGYDGQVLQELTRPRHKVEMHVNDDGTYTVITKKHSTGLRAVIDRAKELIPL